MIRVTAAHHECPGELAGNAALAMLRKIGIGQGFAQDAVHLGRRQYRKKEMVEQWRTGTGGQKMAALCNAQGACGTMQRQGTVGWCALGHHTEVGDAEPGPQLMGYFKAAFFIGSERQGLARELLFEYRLERNGGRADKAEQADGLSGGQAGPVDCLDLFEHRGEGGKRWRGLECAQPGLCRLGILEGGRNVAAGIGEAEPVHGNSFQILL